MRRSTSEKTRSRRVENLKRVAFFLCNGRARNKRKNSCSRASTRAHSRPKRKKRERVLFARDIEWKKNGGGGWKVATSAPFIRDWTTRSVGVAFVSFPKSSGLSLSLSHTHTHSLSLSFFVSFLPQSHWRFSVACRFAGDCCCRGSCCCCCCCCGGGGGGGCGCCRWANPLLTRRRRCGEMRDGRLVSLRSSWSWGILLGLTGFDWVWLGLTNAVASQCRFYGGKTSRRYKRDTTKLECEDIKG